MCLPWHAHAQEVTARRMQESPGCRDVPGTAGSRDHACDLAQGAKAVSPPVLSAVRVGDV
jgi:hypothetical protein